MGIWKPWTPMCLVAPRAGMTLFERAVAAGFQANLPMLLAAGWRALHGG